MMPRSPRRVQQHGSARARRRGRRGPPPGSRPRGCSGRFQCQTLRTSGLSTPMPNAFVQAMTASAEAMNSFCARSARSAERPRGRRGSRAARRSPRRRGASARRRSPGRAPASASPARSTRARRASPPVPSSTSKVRFGRSKPVRTSTGSRSRSRRAMSTATRGVAVAVSAIVAGGRAPRGRGEPAVVGPEVVAPLADAVGLVDHQQVTRRSAIAARKRAFAKRSGAT